MEFPATEPLGGTMLVLGGARSGKSSRAQAIAEHSRPEQVFVATAEALDEEMRLRISKHVADRGDSWTTVESPLALCEAIEMHRRGDRAVLVDCLTIWLSNVMLNDLDPDAEIRKLVAVIETTATPLVVVSNEVGMGIVPESELGRRFRDAQGRLNQAVAASCDRVELMAAGLPLQLKG